VVEQKTQTETETKRPKLGTLVLTRAVNDLIAEDGGFALFVTLCLKRHARGDWGDLEPADRQENDLALGKYLRILSAYEHKTCQGHMKFVADSANGNMRTAENMLEQIVQIGRG
jgi:hypothetical protein